MKLRFRARSRRIDRARALQRLGDSPPPLAPAGTSRFVLTRILGNDDAHRHGTGQTETNLRFVLDHEPDLPRCEKRFVLNRIADPTRRDRLNAILAEAGQEPLVLPFETDAFAGLEPEDHARHLARVRERADRDP